MYRPIRLDIYTAIATTAYVKMCIIIKSGRLPMQGWHRHHYPYANKMTQNSCSSNHISVSTNGYIPHSILKVYKIHHYRGRPDTGRCQVHIYPVYAIYRYILFKIHGYSDTQKIVKKLIVSLSSSSTSSNLVQMAYHELALANFFESHLYWSVYIP